MSSPYEKIILNPVEFAAPSIPEVDLSDLGISIGEAGPEWGESSPVVERVKRLIGEGATSRSWPSVECTIPLLVSTDRSITQAEAYQPIEAFVADVQRRGVGWVRREFSDLNGYSGALGTPVDAAGLITPKGRQPVDEITMKLMRHPFWFATVEVLAGEAKGTSVRDLQLELAELLGTAPGLIRVVVKNEGAEDWRGCVVSVENDDYSSAATAKPKYEATELSPKGGAVISAAAAPEVRAVGTVAAGTGAISPGLPAGTVAGDLLVMVAESGGATAGAEANTALTAAGWTEAPSGSQKQGNTRLTVLYRIATGGDATTTNDTGDHQLARIIGVKAGTFDSKSPFNASTKGMQAATKSVSIPGLATTRDKCLIIACASGNLPDSTTTAEFSASANAALTSVTERIDNTTAEGDGGALLAVTGVLALAGPYSGYPTTATAVTEAERAVISLAVNPVPEAVKCPNLTYGWVTVLSSQIEGVGHMTHVDPRRMIFRIDDVSSVLGDVEWKLEWRALGAAAWVQTQEGSAFKVVTAPVLGNYQLLDLGECRPERAVTGESRWEWRLLARSVSGSGKQPLIRDVYPLSTEQWLRVSDTSENPIDGEFAATGGTVENATGVGTVAWKAKSGSGTMSFANESENPTVTFSGSQVSNYLKVTNLGFSSLIPASANIRGVTVRAVPRTASGVIEEERIRLIVEGIVKEAEDKAGTGGFPIYWNSPETRSWGGPFDLWKLGSISRTQVVASNFGVAIALKTPNTLPEAGETRSICFKRIEIVVAYSEGGNENRICFASRSIEFSDSGVRRQHISDEVWGDLVPEGMQLEAPVGGQEGKPARLLVIPSVGDFATRADSATVKPNAKVYIRPAYLHAREAV